MAADRTNADDVATMIRSEQPVETVAVRNVHAIADQPLADRGRHVGRKKRLPDADERLDDPVVDAAAKPPRMPGDIVFVERIDIRPLRRERAGDEMDLHCASMPLIGTSIGPFEGAYIPSSLYANVSTARGCKSVIQMLRFTAKHRS